MSSFLFPYPLSDEPYKTRVIALQTPSVDVHFAGRDRTRDHLLDTTRGRRFKRILGPGCISGDDTSELELAQTHTWPVDFNWGKIDPARCEDEDDTNRLKWGDKSICVRQSENLSLFRKSPLPGDGSGWLGFPSQELAVEMVMGPTLWCSWWRRFSFFHAFMVSKKIFFPEIL